MAYSNPKFAHRENREGTFDSICRECFATVVTAQREADLEAGERKHICDPEQVERFAGMRGLYPIVGCEVTPFPIQGHKLP